MTSKYTHKLWCSSLNTIWWCRSHILTSVRCTWLYVMFIFEKLQQILHFWLQKWILHKILAQKTYSILCFGQLCIFPFLAVKPKSNPKPCHIWWCIKMMYQDFVFISKRTFVYFSWCLETWITSNALQDNIDIDTGPYFCLIVRESCLVLTKSFCKNQLILKWKTREILKIKGIHKICWCYEYGDWDYFKC